MGVIAILSSAVSPVAAADLDNDQLDDAFEALLAKRFAPQWRFNLRVPHDDSQQNVNEVAFASSPQWFVNEVKGLTGQYPRLYFFTAGNVSGSQIGNVEALSSRVDVNTGRRADDPYWDAHVNLIQLQDYPKFIGGYPEGFPTYVHCSRYGPDEVGIEYYLWYPYDYTGGYTVFDLTFGDHRGDWENVTVIVRCAVPTSSEEVKNSVARATLDEVIYYGHFVPGKRVRAGDPELHLVERDHVMVFVSWGTHATYPEPGEWHNHRQNNAPNVYDDFFHGNGLVVDSWRDDRELVNLGELQSPLVGWLGYRGRWGEDGSAEQGSPRGPAFRGRWGRPGNPLNHQETRLWQSIKRNWGIWFENPPEIDNFNPMRDVTGGGEPVAVLFTDNLWRGAYKVLSQGSFADLAGYGDEVSSVFLLDGAKLTLFEHTHLAGRALELTHSCPDLKSHYDHGFGDLASSCRVRGLPSEVWVDYRRAGHYEDGRQTASALGGPYSTLGRAVSRVQIGGKVYIKGGRYRGGLRVNKEMRWFALGDTVRVE